MIPIQYFLEFDEAVTLFRKKQISPFWKLHTARRLVEISHAITSNRYGTMLQEHYNDGLFSALPLKRLRFEVLSPVLFFHLRVIEAMSLYYDQIDTCTEPLKELEGKKAGTLDAAAGEFVANVMHAVHGLNGKPRFRNIVPLIKVYYKNSSLLQEVS